MSKQDKRNFAVFIDMENAGGKVAMLNSIIEKVKIRGDILLGKCYGYSERYENLKEVLLSNTFQAVPSLKHGVSQKNSLDIQLVIDALEVAFSNPLIDSFCIVSGDSDFTPLVGKLKSMGKFVMGISRSEVASQIFINACNEFVFLEAAVSAEPEGKRARSTPKAKAEQAIEHLGGIDELQRIIDRILSEQADENGLLYASTLKDTLLRLRPDFSEKNYGQTSFGKLLHHLEKRFGHIKTVSDEYSLLVRAAISEADEAGQVETINKENFIQVFSEIFRRYKDEGFERVNPSIVKAAIQSAYPDFDEKQIGFRRFSDVIKRLEKEGVVEVEFNEAMTMLIKIL